MTTFLKEPQEEPETNSEHVEEQKDEETEQQIIQVMQSIEEKWKEFIEKLHKTIGIMESLGTDSLKSEI